MSWLLPDGLYTFRADGRFAMCHCVCANCGEQWEAHPMSNYQPLCDACIQVVKWMAEEQEKS